MSGFICCFWWFLLGLLLGWLLNWLFDKFFRRGGSSSGDDAVRYRAPIVTPLAPPPPPSLAPVSAPAASFSPAVSGGAAGVSGASLASAAAAFGFSHLKSPNGYDNFEIIEGIGPKINGVLHAAGVHTFPALADMDVAAIAKILDAAGPNFKLANPGSWGEQAALCARGSWDALKTLQDDLVAGVALKPDQS